jgi:glutaconate CoA-transferase subunit B
MNDIYLYVPRHSRVTFVKQLDFLSGLGHHIDRRKGSGPRYLVTDLGQFDFDQGRMRLTHLHPNVELERVEAKTGFDFEISTDYSVSVLPSEEEIRLLREEIDPLGIRKLEFLTGPERRRALRIALEKESAHRP